MIEEEIEVENKQIIERLEDSYICYNCKNDLSLCSHAYWLCHNCEDSSDPAKFESYPNGVLSPGGVATLLKGIKNSKFIPHSNAYFKVGLLENLLDISSPLINPMVFKLFTFPAKARAAI